MATIGLRIIILTIKISKLNPITIKPIEISTWISFTRNLRLSTTDLQSQIHSTKEKISPIFLALESCSLFASHLPCLTHCHRFVARIYKCLYSELFSVMYVSVLHTSSLYVLHHGPTLEPRRVAPQ